MKNKNAILELLKAYSSENSYAPEYTTQGTLVRGFCFGVDNSIKFLKSSYTKGLTELRDLTMEDNGPEVDSIKVERKTEYLENITSVKQELDKFQTLALEAHKNIVGKDFVPPTKGATVNLTKDEINDKVKALAESI